MGEIRDRRKTHFWFIYVFGQNILKKVYGYVQVANEENIDPPRKRIRLILAHLIRVMDQWHSKCIHVAMPLMETRIPTKRLEA